MNIIENTITVDEIVQPRFSTPLEATHAAPSRSHRYGFISTADLVSGFREAGFTPRTVQLARVRKEENQGFQKHLIRFQHESLQLRVGGDALPEVVLLNSHDGSTSARLALGLFRLVCSNGLVAGNFFEDYKVYHRSQDIGGFIEAATRITQQVPLLADRVARYQQHTLTDSEVKDFTQKAVELRYPQPEEGSPLEDRYQWENRLYYAARTRRYEDSGNTLWKVFNRLQENLVTPRRGTGIRRITAPQAEVKINQQLWNLADSYLLN